MRLLERLGHQVALLGDVRLVGPAVQLGEAELDGHGIGAPQRGEKERERGASDVERAMLRHEGGMVA